MDEIDEEDDDDRAILAALVKPCRPPTTKNC
jgi:hypothetical protein